MSSLFQRCCVFNLFVVSKKISNYRQLVLRKIRPLCTNNLHGVRFFFAPSPIRASQRKMGLVQCTKRRNSYLQITEILQFLIYNRAPFKSLEACSCCVGPTGIKCMPSMNSGIQAALICIFRSVRFKSAKSESCSMSVHFGNQDSLF